MACSPVMERAQKSVEATETCSWWHPRMSTASGTHHEPDTRTIDVARALHDGSDRRRAVGDAVHSKNMLTREVNQKKVHSTHHNVPTNHPGRLAAAQHLIPKSPTPDFGSRVKSSPLKQQVSSPFFVRGVACVLFESKM